MACKMCVCMFIETMCSGDFCFAAAEGGGKYRQFESRSIQVGRGQEICMRRPPSREGKSCLFETSKAAGGRLTR